MKEKNIKVITVQTGDERKAGSVRDSKGRPLRDKQGQLLTSQADSKVLQDLATKPAVYTFHLIRTPTLVNNSIRSLIT